MLTAVLLVVSTFLALQITHWLKVRRWAEAVVGGTFLLSYPADLLVSAWSGQTFLVPSTGVQKFEPAPGFVAALMMVVAGTVFLVGCAVDSPTADTPPTAPGPRNQGIARLVIVASLAIVPTVAAVIANGVTQTLASRQTLFGGGFVSLFGYYALPCLVPAAILVGLRYSGIRRLACVGVSITCLGVTALTGSRSGLLLTAVAPTLLILVYVANERSGNASRIIIKTFTFLVLPVAAIGGSAWYLREFRGVTESRPLFLGPDVSQADVLVSLLQADEFPHRATYLGALVWPVPRSLWQGKPITGNAYVSEILTPARYQLTGAETTAGGLGESLVNFGVLGAFVFGILMLGLVFASKKLLHAGNLEASTLGVVVLLRGINVIRGDVVNVAAPLTVALLVWALLGLSWFRRDNQDHKSISPG